MEQYIFFAVQTAVTIVISVVGYLMSRNIKIMDDKQEECSRELAAMKRELQEFKLEVSKEYVTKNDFNETTGQIMSKLDKIMDLIMDINKGKKGE